MRTFKEHQEHPFHYGAPLFATLSVQDFGITLHVDLDKKDRLRDLYYEAPQTSPWIPWLSVLAEFSPGKTFDEALDFSYLAMEGAPEIGVLPVPSLLLRDAKHQLMGLPPSHATLMGLPANSLVCRCFGVYQSQIEELVKDKPKISLAEVSAATMAGAGCASCRLDVELIMKEAALQAGYTEERRHRDSQGRRLRLLGLTPAKFVLKVDPLIQKWLADNQIAAEVEILKLVGEELFVRITPTTSGHIAERVREALEAYLVGELGIPLAVLL